MTEPPWGHKQPAVPNINTYRETPPPTPSPRLPYWLRRLDEGSWHRNKYLTKGYEGNTGWFGIYIWEYLYVLSPLLRADEWARGEDLSKFNPEWVEEERRRLDRLLRDYDLKQLHARFNAALSVND